VLVLIVLAVSVLVVVNRSPQVRVSSQFITGTPEPGGAPVRLDTSLYLPASTPAPAVLLAHGLGATKTSLDSQARDLARNGYVVLTYTARGFGRSGGLIHLDSRKYEVADGSRLLDWLQQRPEVEQRDGKPVLGVAGSSYGGALALMLGAVDHRIEAVAADITWNNLATAVFPNSVGGTASSASPSTIGVYKKLWVGYLFSVSMPSDVGPTSSPTVPAADPAVGPAVGATVGPAVGPASSGCGRFAADICRFYQRAGVGSAAEQATVQLDSAALLRDSSPASVLSQMRAPTLLTQGEQDSLFPLSEADANAKQIAAAGAEVQLRWRSGGHDATDAGDNVSGWQRQFFDQKLRHGSTVTTGSDGSFVLAERGAGISATSGRRVNTTLRAEDGYPAVTGQRAPTTTMALSGPSQVVNAPPAGSPAAVTSLPGLGSVLGAASDAGLTATAGLSTLPGQTASFTTAPLTVPQLITGSSSVSLDVTALKSAATSASASGAPVTATLFASLRDVAPDGSSTLPANLVAPLSIPLSGAAQQQVSIALPWVVAQVPAGHRLALTVSTTDFGYAMPADPRSYRIALDSAASRLSVPSLATRTIRSGTVLWWPVLAGVVLLLCAGYLSWRFRARRRGDRDPALIEVPVTVTDLVKEYADGYRAVDGVSFRVERGQVLGLLGPNGAGKTTTLRVLMGLIMPTAGSVRVFGEEVVPGAAVLAQLGAFVEGPGLLPHLSGRENLELYWAASGRPSEAAEFETVLEIAGLGTSLDRRVKTYSHGMQQRLAIAQAMLGLPEVLVLDEPTNGLDPPQIAEMREVLHRYAGTGRTVIVSSHLLAEVEQTCTHLVVMARGRLVAAGSVAEVAGSAADQLVVADAQRALEVLTAAGISARTVPAKRALEDVFLDLVGERVD
jgi:ABC-2 type transport system ATP-binding protein